MRNVVEPARSFPCTSITLHWIGLLTTVLILNQSLAQGAEIIVEGVIYGLAAGSGSIHYRHDSCGAAICCELCLSGPLYDERIQGDGTGPLQYIQDFHSASGDCNPDLPGASAQANASQATTIGIDTISSTVSSSVESHIGSTSNQAFSYFIVSFRVDEPVAYQLDVSVDRTIGDLSLPYTTGCAAVLLRSSQPYEIFVYEAVCGPEGLTISMSGCLQPGPVYSLGLRVDSEIFMGCSDRVASITAASSISCDFSIAPLPPGSSCETGACCLPSGACVGDFTKGQCETADGTFLGAGTTCDIQVELFDTHPIGCPSDMPRRFTPESVTKMVADGETRLVVRATVPGEGDVTFSLEPTPGEPASDLGTLVKPPASPDARGSTSITVPAKHNSELDVFEAIAILRAPENFVRPSSTDSGRPFRLTQLIVEWECVIEHDVFVEIHRPPVLLIHGIWAGGDWWGWPTPYELQGKVTTYHYPKSSAPLDELITHASQAVEAALLNVRQQGIAALQVDVVAHSSAGLLMRAWINGSGTAIYPYKGPEDCFKGKVNRLITVDTPHYGSFLADWWGTYFSGNTIRAGILNTAAKLVGICLDCGGLETLGSASFFSKLDETRVPAHAIAGTGGNVVIGDLGGEIIADLLVKRKAKFLWEVISFISGDAIERILPPELENDLVSTRKSQQGGLEDAGRPGCQPTMAYASYFPPSFLFEPRQFAVNLTVIAEDPIGDCVLELLNARLGAVPWAASFPAGQGGAALAGINLPDYGEVVDGIVISDPFPGTMVMPGTTVNVMVDEINGFFIDRLLVSSEWGSELVTEPPFVIPINVANEAIGTMTVSAMAFDSQNNLAFALEVPLEILLIAQLQQIEVLNDSLHLFVPGPGTGIVVGGTYNDGVRRNITTGNLGTTYASFDETVVTVDGDGLVTPFCPGETVIVVANGAQAVQVQVVVNTLPCPADLDGNGIVDMQDLGTLMAEWGQVGVLSDFDGGAVAVPDLLYLLAQWGLCPSAEAVQGCPP